MRVQPHITEGDRVKNGTLVVVVTLVCPLLMLSACSHIRVVAFDKRQNLVVIQGGKWASDDDFQHAADEYCHGPATLLAMYESTDDSHTSAQAQRFGNITVAQAQTTSVQRYNKTFSCDGTSPPTSPR
jgi:hypothetical protein